MKETITNNFYSIKDACMVATTGIGLFNFAESLNGQNGGGTALWLLVTIGAAANIFFDAVEHDIVRVEKITANLPQPSRTPRG